jgi:hypothetical protein
MIYAAAGLVLAKGIVQTGIVSRATWAPLAPTTSARQVLRRLSLPVGVASALINTTPLVALLIPASRQARADQAHPRARGAASDRARHDPGGLRDADRDDLELVIAGLARERDVDLNMLSFAAVALPVALVGAVVVHLTSARPRRRGGAGDREPGLACRDPGRHAGARREPPRRGARDLQDPGVRAGRHPALGNAGRARRADRGRRRARVRRDRGRHRRDLAHAAVRPVGVAAVTTTRST